MQQNTSIQFGFHTGFLLLQKETDNFGSNVELRDNFNAVDFSTSLGIEYYINNQISLNTKFSILFSLHLSENMLQVRASGIIKANTIL